MSTVLNPCRCVSFPGETWRAAGCTSVKPLAQNQRRRNVETRARVSSQSRRSPYRTWFQKARGGRVQEKPRREARQDRGRFRLAFGPKIDMFGATIANLRLNKHPQFRGRTMPLIPRTQRESYRKLDPQGQYYRARRRSAVRSSFGGKLSPRQRNANYSDRHAAPFRRGQGDRSI